MDYRNLAYQTAQKYGLDPDMFVRQIQAESAFNPAAVSSAGAIGLGQLMPATAKELGVDPTDPTQNLEGAARYMRQQLDRFGDPALALAAYNAGPSRVAKANGIPDITETQNYVAKILGGKGGASMDNKPAQMFQEQQPQQSQGLLGGLLGGQGIGGALGLSDDMRDRLKMGLLLGSDPRAFSPMVSGIQARGKERRAEAKLQGQINKTEKLLRDKGRDDLADAMLTGAIDPSSAITAALKPAASTAFEVKFNIYKKAMPEATDQEVLAAMEGGPDTPAAIRELEIRAERAGLVAGTPEYKKFFETSGLAQEAAAKAAGKAGGEAAVQAAGAKKDVDFAIQLDDDLLNDPALDKVVGPLQGALPNVSADANRVQAKIDRLSGQAFIAARQMLKGGGQITDFESKRAEAAYSLLMNTRLSDEDYRDALMEFRDAVQAGYNRLMAQAQAGGAVGGTTSPATQPADNDPAGLR